MSADLNLTELTTLAVAQAEESDLSSFFAIVDSTAQTLIGHRLFTILVLDNQSMDVERLYSSQPDTYPAGGRKKMKDTDWGRRLLLDGEYYIGRTEDDIREYFPDHETIIGMGLASILNMPIRRGGQTLGTINLLHEANHYSDNHVPAARLIAGLIASRI